MRGHGRAQIQQVTANRVGADIEPREDGIRGGIDFVGGDYFRFEQVGHKAGCGNVVAATVLIDVYMVAL
jgi:hypothetical protein